MNFDELKEFVRAELGDDLGQASPERIREVLFELQRRIYPPVKLGDWTVLPGEDETADYEKFVLDFFSEALDYDGDTAAVMLWLFAFEMWLSYNEEYLESELKRLLGEEEDEDE